MSEIMSFGNIVNSLRAVRNDYNEHLKSVPQYEAFLLVETSTQKVADTLQGIISSAAPSMAGEVVAALELAKGKFREHLTSVPEYRALLAIDKLISDVAADLGVQPAEAVPVAEAQPEPAVVEAAATSEAEPAVSTHQETVSQAEAPAQEPADEAAVAIASIAEAVSAHLDAAEPTPAYAAAPTEAAEQPSDHHETAIPAPEYGSIEAHEAVAQAAAEQEPSPVQTETFGHATETAPAHAVADAPVEAAIQPAAEQETASHAPDVAEHAPSQPVVIIAEDASEPQPTHGETYGHEAEKAA